MRGDKWHTAQFYYDWRRRKNKKINGKQWPFYIVHWAVSNGEDLGMSVEDFANHKIF